MGVGSPDLTPTILPKGRCMIRMRRRVAGAGLVLAMLVVGCGPSATQSETSPYSVAPTTSPSPTHSATPSTAAPRLPDSRSLRGLTEVPDLSDPKPVDGSFGQKLPVTVTDVENNTVTVTDTSRILALDLYGTLSRTLIGLGMGDKIVGRTVSSTEKQLHDHRERPHPQRRGHRRPQTDPRHCRPQRRPS